MYTDNAFQNYPEGFSWSICFGSVAITLMQSYVGFEITDVKFHSPVKISVGTTTIGHVVRAVVIADSAKTALYPSVLCILQTGLNKAIS